MSGIQQARTFVARDGAVNVVRPYGQGHLEARLLYRDLDNERRRACVYLSSHSGCRMGCQFCWLTQQGQTSMRHASVEQYAGQAREMLVLHDSRSDPRVVEHREQMRLHYNFMARGDPLANGPVVFQWPAISQVLHEMGELSRFASTRCNVSTIMPTALGGRDLRHVFAQRPPWMYYSLYSLDRAFRDKWMPNAMPVARAMDRLAALQEHNGQPLTLHWAAIKDANDSLDDARAIARLVDSYALRDVRFSLVRYNPHPRSGSAEADPKRLDEIRAILATAVRSSKIIERVGKEAYASCGMFPEDDD